MNNPPIVMLALAGLTASTLAVGSPSVSVEASSSEAPEPGTIYLTFDDGPHPEHTQELLEIFQDHGQTTTFFATGRNTEQRPEIAQQILNEGHVLANHTYSHPRLTDLEPEERKEEILSTADILTDLGSTSNCFRPPYGAYDDDVLEELDEFGLQNVMWDASTEDWTEPGVEFIADVIRDSEDGDIVLLHDAGGDRSQTVEAVALVLPEMIEQGYEFKALPDCQ